MSEVLAGEELDGQLMQRLAKVLSDPMQMDIVCECNLRAVSPRSFREAFGGPSLAGLHQAFIELEQFGWIERVPPTGGPPPEDFDRLYRSEQRVLIDNPLWSQLPQSVKSSMTARVVDSVNKRTREAMKAGTIDARDDSHLSMSPLLLDQQGWDAVTDRFKALLDYVMEEQAEAEARMAESGEEPILMTAGLLAFESPRH